MDRKAKELLSAPDYSTGWFGSHEKSLVVSAVCCVPNIAINILLIRGNSKGRYSIESLFIRLGLFLCFECHTAKWSFILI